MSFNVVYRYEFSDSLDFANISILFVTLQTILNHCLIRYMLD